MSRDRVSYSLSRPVYPSPASLVTSVDSEGKPNIITLGETFNLSIREPVIVGIAMAPERYSHTLISEQGEFVVNLPPAALMSEVMAVGSMSGRDHDKFAEIGLTPLPAKQVKPPLIAECPVSIECRLLDVQTIGDHDLFQGEVLEHHVDPAVLGENGSFDPAKLSTICLAGGHFFDLGEHIRNWK
ncbi:MAG: flavin reductase family protein [Candidatus Brocadiae bacterium]|nr:flavin reductase family protein [Candidatus Brocadiia bacterium]